MKVIGPTDKDIRARELLLWIPRESAWIEDPQWSLWYATYQASLVVVLRMEAVISSCKHELHSSYLFAKSILHEGINNERDAGLALLNLSKTQSKKYLLLELTGAKLKNIWDRYYDIIDVWSDETIEAFLKIIKLLIQDTESILIEIERDSTIACFTQSTNLLWKELNDCLSELKGKDFSIQ